AGVNAEDGAPRPGRTSPRELLYKFLPFLNGSGETYRTFMSYQGYVVMVVLALAGSVLIGNDIRFGSLPFYLSKPLGLWHYLFGKALAVGVFINLMTTVPALILFVEFTVLYPPAGDTVVQMWGNWAEKQLPLFWGVLGYGAVLSSTL